MSNNADIDCVLSAQDYYEILGIQPEDALDDAILRKAYLRRSVKVHPDKNDGDPRATQAFQRVTQAYNVLSDERSRAEYDRHGENSSDNDTGDTYYARAANPSYEDATFVFASVASMMGSGRAGAAADIAQAMYFAETFLSKDKEIDLSDGKSKAQAAMAAGASLRVVGSAVRAAGFKKSAAALDSAATMVQVAGLGTMVADSPAVKKALEEPAVKRTIDAGSQKLSQLGGSLSAARQAMMNRKDDTFQQSAESAGRSSNSKQGQSAGASIRDRFSQMGTAAREAAKNRGAGGGASAQQHEQQQARSSTNTNDRNGQNDNYYSNDSYSDTVNKARTAGAAAGSIRKGAEAAKKMGFNKHAADMEHAADMAEMVGKAAKVADNPMVKNVMQQPAVKRMVESGAEMFFEQAMKQGTSKTNA